MPKNLEECVKKLMDEGKTKEEAYTICQAATDDSKCTRGFSVADSLNDKIEKFVDPVTGFLHVTGVIARSGIQEYYGMELPFDNLDPLTKYAVLRPDDEVKNPDSIRSFINSPITDEHPSTLVTSDNYKNYAKGSVSVINVIEDDETLLQTDMTIYDSALSEKASNGKVKISAGYVCDVVDEAGEHKGVPYRFKQINIRGNHVAIVDSPRCGDTCKMAFDSDTTITDETTNQGTTMAKIVIGEVEYEVPDEVAAYIESLKAEEVAEGEASMDEDMEKLKAERDMLKETLQTQTTDADKIAGMVAERAELIGTAKTMGVAVVATDSALSIKSAILKDKRGIDTKDKTEAYISAAFDMLMGDQAAAAASHQRIADEAKDHKAVTSFDEIKDKEY